jgi:hypothetical protein
MISCFITLTAGLYKNSRLRYGYGRRQAGWAVGFRHLVCTDGKRWAAAVSLVHIQYTLVGSIAEYEISVQYS